MTDIDGRADDLGVPDDNMWTDGADPPVDLARLMAVRRVALDSRADPQFDNEVFQNAGAAVFGPLVAADFDAQVTLDTLLAPSRLRRIA